MEWFVVGLESAGSEKDILTREGLGSEGGDLVRRMRREMKGRVLRRVQCFICSYHLGLRYGKEEGSRLPSSHHNS